MKHHTWIWLIAVFALGVVACVKTQPPITTSYPAQSIPSVVQQLGSTVVKCTVFATREGLVGETTANGHVIQPLDRFAALPSRSALAGNNGQEFQVRISYQDKTVVVPIWDVGPWNTRDNYWDTPEQRQEWKDLPQCRPQAQAAHEDGYNDSQDQFGRQVKNPAGIDLADGTWADLGLPDNDWVVVEFLWTEDVSVSAAQPPSPALTKPVSVIAPESAFKKTNENNRPPGFRSSDSTWWFNAGVWSLPVTDIDPGQRSSGLYLTGCYYRIVDTGGRDHTGFRTCNSEFEVRVGPPEDDQNDCVTEGLKACTIFVGSRDRTGSESEMTSESSTQFSVDYSPPGVRSTSAAEPEARSWALDLTGIVPFEALGDMALLEIGGKQYVIRVGSNMIQVVDISDPALPVDVSRLDLRGEATAILLATEAIDTSGHYAFVVTRCSNTSGSKLFVVDVADPLSPKLAGQSDCFSPPSRTISYLDANGNVQRDTYDDNYYPHIVVTQGQAYVGVAGGIKVFDIAVPSSPRLVSSLETEGVIRGMVRDGSNVYVAEWLGDKGSKLSIIDASGGTPPEAVASVLFAMPNYASGLRIQAVDGRVYVLQKGDLSKLVVHVVDATNPVSPVLVGDWEIETPQGDLLCYPEIVGGYLYVPISTDHEIGGGRAIQLLTLQLAKLSETLSSSWQKIGPWTGCIDAETTGDILVLTNGNRITGSGMTILDVSDPAIAQEIGAYDGITQISDGAVSGPYAYLTTRQRFIVVDVSVPGSPHVVGSLLFSKTGWLGGVVVSEGYAYVGGGVGVRVIDVSDPRLPREVAVMNHGTWEEGVQLDGSLAYGRAPASSVIVVDLSEQGEPRVIATIPGSIGPNGIKLQGGYLYLIGYMEDLGGSVFAIFDISNFDISNPENPPVFGAVQLPIMGGFQPPDFHALHGVLEIQGSYAYVATKGHDPKLSVIDISDPSSPTVIGTTSIKPNRYGSVFLAADMDVQGRLAIVVGLTDDFGSAKGVSVIDISDPEQPREIGEYPGPRSSIVLNLPLAYAAGGNSSVLLDLSVPAEPSVVDSVAFGGKIIATSDPMRYFLASFIRGFATVQVTKPSVTQTPITPASTPLEFREVRSIAGRITAVNVQENVFVVLQPKEEREFRVILGQETEFIRLVFPFDINNPPPNATFTPERELITIEDLKVGDQVFVRSNNPIRAGKAIVGPLAVQVLP